ncbi:MAG: hypothetical protein LRZ99_00145 [Desulfotomaculum sp.]|nr:hypothetical protein [Desulfotomaculum sp.]
MHRLILKGIDDQNAGIYRTENVMISGATHIPPDFLSISGEMAGLIKWYQEDRGHTTKSWNVPINLIFEIIKVIGCECRCPCGL